MFILQEVNGEVKKRQAFKTRFETTKQYNSAMAEIKAKYESGKYSINDIAKEYDLTY